MATTQIDPVTGERIATQAPQIDPATGERIAAASSAPVGPTPYVDTSNVAGAGPGGVPQPAAHPAANMQSSVLSPAPYIARVKETAAGLLKPWAHPVDSVMSYPGFVDPSKQGGPIQDITQNPDKGEGIANAITDTGTALALGKATDGVLALPGAVKAKIAGNVNEPIIGTNITPSQRYASAQRLGVNLDAADATNSPLLKGLKSYNENSLLGANSYDKLHAANTSALQGSTEGLLDSMYPGGREEGGVDIQKALKSDQSKLYGDATSGFESLPHDHPLPLAENLGAYAKQLGDKQAGYYDQFPSLQPSKALNVVSDVAKLGDGPNFRPDGYAGQVAPAPKPTFGTIQRLRSDLLDFNRNNPDIIKNQSGGWIQDLTGKADNVMTDGAKGLPPGLSNVFRDANAKWEDMKQTYDDPSSPFYHAVRTDNPSSLYAGVGPKTPENARNLINRLGGAGSAPPAAVGAVRRGTVEGALKTNAEGAPNFKTFGTQLNRIPADYRAELFSPDQNRTLQDVANTSNVLKMDANPSGSGKLIQKVGEAGAIGAGLAHPLLAAPPLLQYPVAKFMNSPRAVNWLMAPTARPNPFVAPAVAAAVNSPKKKGLYGGN